tara:strand:- start:2957 stop:4240 length:1284 start_codon:yes stop_codon:yes gene_type:complete
MNINSLFEFILNRQVSDSYCFNAFSNEPSLDKAVKEVCSKLRNFQNADIAVVLISSNFSSDYPRLLPLLKEKLKYKKLIGSGIGGVIELNKNNSFNENLNVPSLSITLLKLSNTNIIPFHIPEDTNIDMDNPSKVWKNCIKDINNLNNSNSFCSAILFADPSMRRINQLISSFDFSFPKSNLIGGIATYHPFSYGSLFFEEQLCKGAVGFLINGEWRIETLVTQGVKPLGPIIEVHSVHKNILYQIKENKKLVSPVQFLQQLIGELSLSEKDLLQQSLFLGVENKSMKISSKGKLLCDGTFVVRDLLGIDPTNGALAITDVLSVGQKVQFQSIDMEISQKEIEIGIKKLMQNAKKEPILTFLFSCIGRSKSYSRNNYKDIKSVNNLLGSVPICGGFFQGEIGQINGNSYLHSYSSCWGLLIKKNHHK